MIDEQDIDIEDLEGPEGQLNELLHKEEILDRIRRKESEGEKSIRIDFDRIVEQGMELAKEILKNPTIIETGEKILGSITSGELSNLRIYNLPDKEEIRELGADHIAKLSQIEGVLVEMSDVLPESTIAVFECQKCGELNRVKLAGDKFRTPTVCQNPNCAKKGPFKLKTEESKFIDWQHIKIQERPEKLSGGETPRTVSAIVRDDLVNSAKPGTRVVVTGVLRAYKEKKKKKKNKVFKKILDVNDLEVREGDSSDLDEEDIKEIEKLKEENRIDRLFIESIAPNIYGHGKVKEGLSLQMVSSPPLEKQGDVKNRGNIHILVCGDYGTGKSELIDWVGEVAPRAVRSSGKKSSGAGLTATAVRDEVSGGWSLKAGALSLADRGMAIIDEFDKMESDEYESMLEALSQQKISISKAGMNTTLNTRTSLLAAANPDLGRFDLYREIPEQIDIPPLLMDRFDLIYIVKDEPDKEKDRELAEHVLNLEDNETDENVKILDRETLKNIIIYARDNIHPTIPDEMLEKISDYYVKKRGSMRQKQDNEEVTISITPRQLEAIQRLSKASARLRLSEEVIESDVERAKDLIEHYLQSVGLDPETEEVDMLSIGTGKSRSQREKFRTLHKIVSDFQDDYKDGLPIGVLVEEAQAEGIDEDMTEEWVKKGKQSGKLYAPTNDTVRIAT